MDILEIIRTRRSIRKYEPEPISEEEINKILEAGRGAPHSRPHCFLPTPIIEARAQSPSRLPYGRWQAPHNNPGRRVHNP